MDDSSSVDTDTEFVPLSVLVSTEVLSHNGSLGGACVSTVKISSMAMDSSLSSFVFLLEPIVVL